MDNEELQLPQDVADYIIDITEDFVGQGKTHLVTAVCSHAFAFAKRKHPQILEAYSADVLTALLRDAAHARLELYEEHSVIEYRQREDGMKVMAIISAPNPKTGEYPAVFSGKLEFGQVFIPDFLSWDVTAPDVKIAEFMADSGLATHLSAAHDTLLADCGVEVAHCLRPHTGCAAEDHPNCGTRKSAIRLGAACAEALKIAAKAAHEEAAYIMAHCRFTVLDVSTSIVSSTDVVSNGAAQIMELSKALIDAQEAGTISELGADALDAMRAYSQANRAVIPTVMHAGKKLDMLIALKEQMGADRELRDAFMKVFGAMFRPSAIAIPKEAVTELLDKISLAQAAPMSTDDSSNNNNGPTFH